MKMSFRWYGPTDPVSLRFIRQIPNMRGVVSAVYDVAPGEVWPTESIASLKREIEAESLAFDVVESIPVHEDIKLGLPTRARYIENYCENIRRVGAQGVRCVCYNFMPVFDWTRTQLAQEAPDGSTSLAMHMGKIRGLDPLRESLSLPGWDSSYGRDELKKLFESYADVGDAGLRENLAYFLKAVVPAAEEAGVRMAIHPDDPPMPIFGLPRIVSNERDLDELLAVADSPSNSLTLCTGSLGSSLGNDVPALTRKYSARGRVAFMHIRNVRDYEDGSFEESGHLSKDGSLDLYEIVRALTETGFDGYVRPDHGRMIWGETGKPGYGLYDRALGSAYLNGLFEACEKAAR